MDPDNGSVSRVERTMWSVWYYLTGAVNRFLRPEPTTTEYNDHDSFQEPAVDSEPADTRHPDSGGPGVDEERPLATASMLSSSRPVVAWELCSTGDDFGPEEEIMQYRSQLSGGPESKASEEAEGTREEQLGQTGTDDARLVKAAKEDIEVEDGHKKSYTHGQEETTENEGPLNITDDDMSEELRGNGRQAGAEEDDHGKVYEKGEDDKMQHEHEPTLEMEDAEITLCRMTDFSSEEEHYMHIEEAKVQRDAAEDRENRDGVSQLGSEINIKYDEGRKQVEHQLLVCEELSENDREVRGDPGSSSLEDELNMTLGKSGKVSEGFGHEHVMGELGGDEEEAADHQAIDEDSFTEHVACNEEVVQNSEAELQTAEFRDKEKEDVAKDTEVQTIVPETDDGNDAKSNVATTDVSVEERFFYENQTEVESFSSEVKDNKESNMEAACTTALVTVIPKGQTGQEISGEFKNIPPGVGEGHAVVVEELHSPTSQGTQEGVPEYNNEPGPDENTTQRFLEVGNYKESDATQLPEEVESKEWENLQNSGTGGGFSPVREHLEEEQDRTEDFKDTKILQLTDAGIPQETEELIVEPAIEGSGQKDETFSSSMRTRVGQLEEESETHVGATEETPKKTEEQDGTEELLVDFETHEDLSGTKDAAGGDGETTGETLKILKAEEQKMTEMSFYQVSGDAQQNRIKTLDLEDIIESGFMKQLDEPKLPEGSSAEMQDAGIDMEETGSGVEEQGTEDEMQNKNKIEALNLAAELTSENNKNIWFEKSELTKPDESLENKNQPSDEASEASAAEDQLMTTKGKTKDLDVIGEEEMEKLEAESEESSVSGSQDLIDEEILDLWIETASFKDADGMEQREGPEPGRQLVKKGEEQSDETEEENEKLVESMSGESGLVSDTEMSPSAAESGLLDQSVSEWSTDHSESHLLESTSSGSLQDILDLFAGALESADVSELSTRQPDPESQDVSLEEAAETGQSDLTEEESTTETGFHPGSGIISLEAGCFKVRSDKSQDKTDEERVESAETETGKQKEIDWKDSEDEDNETLYTEEKTEDADAPREAAASDSPDETEHAESGRPGSGSEVLLQDEITMADSEDVACAEKLEQPQDASWWEDIAEVAEEPTTTTQVDASALDFTPQKSRIAVKNPRVRPPSDPRSLLNMPSADPTPSSRLPVRVPTGVPLGGMGIGIKLPGLGAGFPTLKKTKRVMTEEKSSETFSQEPESKPEEKSDAIKQDEEKHKPKWMPPRHPGFGNPLMSELKNKLRKPTNE
ncbi:uncharacterized protein si:ch211-136m16.8 [Hippoglossus hippoglossus]|uniref:uncharacterized protein si:ch211-136m16.8 n=1 Tax=Hippoglossus hippoglossus TaxID=8267 RepID=UPI00148C1E5C|nr:uncharacterized protein si:ch211-136m16.8 [Hippoglossus hippoglossus]